MIAAAHAHADFAPRALGDAGPARWPKLAPPSRTVDVIAALGERASSLRRRTRAVSACAPEACHAAALTGPSRSIHSSLQSLSRANAAASPPTRPRPSMRRASPAPPRSRCPSVR